MEQTKNILVSIVMCSFNTPKDYIFEAVLSILQQTHRNFELIIVDDGSNQPISLSDFPTDPRILLLRNDTNRGISYSRNKAIDISKGKYIAIMDSDDFSYPNRLKEQVDFMESHPNVVTCGSWFEYFGDKKSVCKRVIDNNEYYRACLLFENSPTLLDPSSFTRMSVIKNNHFKYNENMKIGMDYLLWVQLSQIGIVTNIKKVLVKYRLHCNQITNNRTINKRLANWEVIKIQLQSLGIKNISDYRDYFVKELNDYSISLKQYRDFLDSLLMANKFSNFFNQKLLEQRIEIQWKRKILNTKSFKLLRTGCREMPKRKKEIIRVALRHFNVFMHNKTK